MDTVLARTTNIYKYNIYNLFIVWTTWSEFPSRPNVNAWPNELIKVDGYTRIDIARSTCCSTITQTKHGKSLAWPAAPIVCYSRVFCSATRVLCTCERHKHARAQTQTGLPWKRLKRFVANVDGSGGKSTYPNKRARKMSGQLQQYSA